MEWLAEAAASYTLVAIAGLVMVEVRADVTRMRPLNYLAFVTAHSDSRFLSDR